MNTIFGELKTRQKNTSTHVAAASRNKAICLGLLWSLAYHLNIAWNDNNRKQNIKDITIF
jgi:hypothetical protein